MLEDAKMLVTLLMLLPLVGAHWPKHCHTCRLPDNPTKEDKLQRQGFISDRGEGNSEHIDVAMAKANGVVIYTGKVCNTPCKPYWKYSVHGCRSHGIYQACAPYNKDQYGRECEVVDKGAWERSAYCYVKNGDKYWLHNGGSWGYTHYPICVGESRICMDTDDWD